MTVALCRADTSEAQVMKIMRSEFAKTIKLLNEDW